jgi:CheY-like chemotaxis protein
VLVVDDDPHNLERIRLLLEMSGYIVDIAATGREAIEKTRRNGADVALLDTRLPDMPGQEVAEVLRRERAPLPILLVAISGLSPLDPRREPPPSTRGSPSLSTSAG